MALATNSNLYGQQATFVYAFIGAQTWTTFVPGSINSSSAGGQASPNYNGLLPFFNPKNGTSAIAAAAKTGNAAVVAFRKQMSLLLASYPAGAARYGSSNWGYPMAMPSAIEL